MRVISAIAAIVLACGMVAAGQAPAAPVVFNKPMAAGRLAFLASFAAHPSGLAIRDQRLRKLLSALVPDCAFHYGRDMALENALELALAKSPELARLSEGRYLLLSSAGGRHAFLWMDLQSGIALGGIFFRPSNGEPTPTLTIFSRQVKVSAISMGQLPAAFATDLRLWQRRSRIPRLSPRYFIGGNNAKIVLEHDWNFCAPSADGTPAPPSCRQVNADAADIDLNAAYYLEQTHHAPNATARMIIGPEQVAWSQLRRRTCRSARDVLGCRLRLTRERIRVIIHPRRQHRRH